MRAIGIAAILGLAAPLGGCSQDAGIAVLAANAAAVPIIHRTLPDAVYSLITGRNCSLVRLDRDESYCKPVEPPPTPPPLCTRTLGVINCWANPDGMPGSVTAVAAGPSALSPEQERDRTARWPKF